SISPYLQRAEELRTKEPIVAYWCTYYAAQIGISLKAKDTASRDFLLHLLGELERMKQEIGPTDAIDVEAASSAYVENFALRVFAAADNEDRSGNVTRSTAKKFLAAAHFLEVLKTFPKSEVSESASLVFSFFSSASLTWQDRAKKKSDMRNGRLPISQKHSGKVASPRPVPPIRASKRNWLSSRRPLLRPVDPAQTASTL
ncbi:unnamed protein product, partial [Mycena citricolor]